MTTRKPSNGRHYKGKPKPRPVFVTPPPGDAATPPLPDHAPTRTVNCLGVGAIAKPHTFATTDLTGGTRICYACQRLLEGMHLGRAARQIRNPRVT